jgi:hypothetical protein
MVYNKLCRIMEVKKMKKAVFLLMAAGLIAVGQAASVVMTANDTNSATTSFNSNVQLHWSPAGAPSAGNTYSTMGFLLRTPTTAGNYTFAGDSLLVGGGSGGAVFAPGAADNNCLINKTPVNAGVAPIITVNNLTLNGSSIRDGMGTADIWHLAGNIAVAGVGGNFICQESFYVDSVISGSAPLYIGGNGSGEAGRTVYITSATNTYNGTIQLMGTDAAHARLTFSDNSRMNFAIGASGTSNRIFGTGTAVFNGDFNFDLTGAGMTIGDSWTIAGVTSQTFGATFTVIGFTDAGDNIWAKLANGVLYEFSESTGILTAAKPKPNTPSVEEVTQTTVVLHWNAAPDPTGVNAVNPDIVDQYVFMTKGTADPNLYYVGATGFDPGITDPASKYPGTGTITIATDTTYRWAVVEAMAGYTQTFTPGVSKITQVEPNNIIGPSWTYESPISIPVIAAQPANVRVLATDPNAVFTCTFSSINPATVAWYKSGTSTPLADNADYNITSTNDGSGNYTAMLEILTPAVGDEGGYYCTINNGTPLVTSTTATLIVNRLLAQYNFDGTLAPAAGSAADAPTGQGKSINGLTEPNSLLATNVTLTPVDGIDADTAAGDAIRLNLNEYIDFGVNGYPKADAAIANGYGGGLDAGTIVYWVKLDTDAFQVVLGNFNDTTAGTGFMSAIQADGDLDLLIRNGGPYVANHVAARSNRPEYDPNDGNWHMMAACWSGNASTLYVDGQWVGAFTDAIPASYDAWQRGVLLGATRQASRHLLSDLLRGASVDNLRIYNYRLDAGNVEAFAQEYQNVIGIAPCTNMSFVGNAYNYDNTGSSYCKVDFADFVLLAGKWLNSGLYVEP